MTSDAMTLDKTTYFDKTTDELKELALGAAGAALHAAHAEPEANAGPIHKAIEAEARLDKALESVFARLGAAESARAEMMRENDQLLARVQSLEVAVRAADLLYHQTGHYDVIRQAYDRARAQVRLGKPQADADLPKRCFDCEHHEGDPHADVCLHPDSNGNYESGAECEPPPHCPLRGKP